jgi:hypothetical protein
MHGYHGFHCPVHKTNHPDRNQLHALEQLPLPCKDPEKPEKVKGTLQSEVLN